MNHPPHAIIPYEEANLAGLLVEADDLDLCDLIADALDTDALLDCYEGGEGERAGNG